MDNRTARCVPPIIKNAQGYQFCNIKASNTETWSKKRKSAWLGSSTEVCRHRRQSGEEMTSQKGVVTAPARSPGGGPRGGARQRPRGGSWRPRRASPPSLAPDL